MTHRKKHCVDKLITKVVMNKLSDGIVSVMEWLICFSDNYLITVNIVLINTPR